MSVYGGVFESSRKRPREDDDEFVTSPAGFAEHRQKRHQCLSWPANSQQKRWSDPPVIPLNASRSFPDTITPAASDCGEEARRLSWGAPTPLNRDALGLGLQSQGQGDMDVDMEIAASPPARDPNSLEPGAFHEEAVAATTVAGRIPTPIQPSFAAQVRGGPWSGPGPALSHHSGQQHQPQPPPQLNGLHNLGHHTAGFEPSPSSMMGARAIPRTMDSDAEWTAVRDRRLPSPISEGDDCFSPTLGSATMASPGVVLDGGFTNQLAARLASSISISTPGDQMMDLEDHHHDHDYDDHERYHQAHRGHRPGHSCTDDDIATTTVDAPQQPTEANSAPATPSPGKKGHSRSRHTINTWTWQPGMKKSFSIGYRADCEKCRLKVPGHFNHIIIS